jgi:hypothetical protein
MMRHVCFLELDALLWWPVVAKLYSKMASGGLEKAFFLWWATGCAVTGVFSQTHHPRFLSTTRPELAFIPCGAGNRVQAQCRYDAAVAGWLWPLCWRGALLTSSLRYDAAVAGWLWPLCWNGALLTSSLLLLHCCPCSLPDEGWGPYLNQNLPLVHSCWCDGTTSTASPSAWAS